MSAQTETVRRLSVLDIAKLYADGMRIATITAYDFPTAAIVDEAGIPLILVGDSLAQVMLGYDTTVRVTMDEMLHHTKAVVRGTKRALIVADMPFLSYPTPEEALHNAGRFMREAGVQAVKLEGGVRSARMIEALVKAGIPVMGHIGLTPQAINTLGKVRVQGKNREQARPAAGRRARGPGGRGVRGRAGARARSSSPRRSPSACASRRSGSGRAPGARARSRSSTTRWATATGRRSTRGSTRTSRRRSSARSRSTGRTSRPGRSRARRRPCAWTTPCSTRCSAAPPRTWPTGPVPLAGIPLDRDL